jgi:hypothetical protein
LALSWGVGKASLRVGAGAASEQSGAAASLGRHARWWAVGAAETRWASWGVAGGGAWLSGVRSNDALEAEHASTVQGRPGERELGGRAMRVTGDGGVSAVGDVG